MAFLDHLLGLTKAPGDKTAFELLKSLGIAYKVDCKKTKTFSGASNWN